MGAPGSGTRAVFVCEAKMPADQESAAGFADSPWPREPVASCLGAATGGDKAHPCERKCAAFPKEEEAFVELDSFQELSHVERMKQGFQKEMNSLT